jgi:hypothetical protein
MNVNQRESPIWMEAKWTSEAAKRSATCVHRRHARERRLKYGLKLHNMMQRIPYVLVAPAGSELAV